MNLSAIFIRRPVATSLLTLAIGLCGMLAFMHLPIAALPEVDFPTLSVTAQVPGASAETMAATVAAPLERALGRIAGLAEMSSSSSQGSTRITLQFDLDRDIDGASRDIQAAINAAAGQLPGNMPRRPSYRRDNPGDSPILVLALTSEQLSRGQLYDAASSILLQKISQVPGVGVVDLGGAALPAVRVELNPNALGQYGIGLDDVRNTIARANVTRPKGSLENAERRWQIQANDQAARAADYAPLIIRYRNGAAIRLADVGQVIDSVEDLRTTGLYQGKPAVMLVIRKQPKANVIETVDRILEMLPRLRAALPPRAELALVVDRSQSIRASIVEVEHSLLIAVLLVMAVVLAFLRHPRSAAVPVVAVPVSLLGACAVMYFCGFSLNNLTLMALTIATGFVVDDAIVVVENSNRHIEQGMSPLAAALLSTREVGFTVLAMSVSLVAVFLPILLMGGVPGRLFREFALTLSAAVLVSLLISLTATPMLCARWLGRERGEHGRVYRALGAAFDAARDVYRRSLGWALAHGRLMLAILLATIALNVYLYRIIDKGFFPSQDGGRLMGQVMTDQGASFQVLEQGFARISELVRQDPAVDNVAGFGGGSDGGNSARVFITLKPHRQRDRIEVVMERLRKLTERLPGVRLYMFPAQELRMGGRMSFGSYDYTLQADDLDSLAEWTPKVREALSRLPELKDVNSSQQDKGQQIGLVVNRDAAARFGVSQSLIDATLNNAFGQRQVSVIYNPLNQYRVVMELAPQYWQSPESLKQLYISVPAPPGADGEAAAP
ncbi:efflux RND transporter permease subunit, partial [Methylomonas sp. SURF-2]